jgi:hypothetical protein
MSWGMAVAALEEIEQPSVGDAVAQRVVTSLQLADLVSLAQAFDFNCDIRHSGEQRSEVRDH